MNNRMTALQLIHANRKGPVVIFTHQIFSYYRSTADKCVHLLAIGGAIIPVSESIETISELLTVNIIKEPNNDNQNN